ncbi:MAG: hypothetical protein AAGG72_10255, partial [Pseudomonadota bacterium]
DQKLAHGFEPHRIDTPTTIFHAAGNDFAAFDATLGWARYCGDIVPKTLSGRHHQLMQDPSLAEVVAVLQSDLERSINSHAGRDDASPDRHQGDPPIR